MPLSSDRADRRIPEALSSVRFSRIRQALKGWPFPFLALDDIIISPDVRFAKAADRYIRSIHSNGNYSVSDVVRLS